MQYSPNQHREYINLARKCGNEWLHLFADNNEFYATHYWDLLTEMWYANKPLMVSDALRFMKSIKSPYTARKYLQRTIDENYVVERKNPNDDRSTLVELSSETRKNLDKFFDRAIANMIETVGSIKSKS